MESKYPPRRFICNFLDGKAEFNDTNCPPAIEYLSLIEHEDLLLKSTIIAERYGAIKALESYPGDTND